MPDVLTFEEAVTLTEGEERALLVGNGFSAQYFSYTNLLDKSGLMTGSPLRNIFDALGTVDFEAVVRALEGAAIVEQAYGNASHATDLITAAQTVREALVEAVRSTHPQHRDDLAFKYTSSAKFLSWFKTVFSLNYDLLLYWVNLEKGLLADGFGLGCQCGTFHGPFRDGAYCHLYSLHGGLHLFENDAGEILKAIDTGSGVIANITDAIASRRQFPVYVAEGTSNQKMRKINSVEYLRHCYDRLQSNSGTMFIYGHSADENDAHIYRAIFTSKAKHLYFGVYQLEAERLNALDGLLAKYQRTSGSRVPYTFFDSESAAVWT